MNDSTGSHPFRCLMCDDQNVERLERQDATVTWACLDHYETVLADFRRWPSEPIFIRPSNESEGDRG